MNALLIIDMFSLDLMGGINKVDAEVKKSSLNLGVGATLYCLVANIKEVCFLPFLFLP